MKVIEVIITILILTIIINLWLKERAKTKQVQATLMKKKSLTNITSKNVFIEKYYLYFDVKGRRKKFMVNYKEYNKHKKNSSGILIYKRRKFVDFTKVQEAF